MINQNMNSFNLNRLNTSNSNCVISNSIANNAVNNNIVNNNIVNGIINNNPKNSNNSNDNILWNSSDLRQQLFSLNKLSIERLRQKWFELYKVNPNNFKRGYLIKGLAYKIQYLYGLSNISDEEIKTSLTTIKQKSMAKQKQNNCRDGFGNVDKVNSSNVNSAYNSAFNSNYGYNNNSNYSSNSNNNLSSNSNPNNKKTKSNIILPPVGSILTAHYKNKECVVKILEDNKFSYNNKVYTSLSAIASEISGTRWNGYAFFHLK
jgi:hypothetical protein